MTQEQRDKLYCERLAIIGAVCGIVGLVGFVVGLRGQREAVAYKELASMYHGQARQASDALKLYVRGIQAKEVNGLD